MRLTALRRVFLVLIAVSAAQLSVAPNQAKAEEALPPFVCRTACAAAVAGCCYTAIGMCPACVRAYNACYYGCLLI